MGSGSHCVRCHSVAQRGIRQASLRLLHCHEACDYDWCRVLGMEGLSGRAARLDLGVCRRGLALESLLAYSDAAHTVATN